MSEEHPRANDHYFTADPSRPASRSSFRVRAAGRELELEASSGVFSSRGLDKGTAVLLDHLAAHPPATPPDGSAIVDVGCGAGSIALSLAVMYPRCRVVAVDVNSRALELCADNALRNGIANVTCVHPDDIDDSLRPALIVSNPPIRVGKQELHGLLAGWLSRLDRDGSAILVVSRHLGADSLARWMQDEGHTVTRLASSKGFRILEVRPRPGGESEARGIDVDANLPRESRTNVVDPPSE